MWRQTDVAAEGAGQREGTAPGDVGQLIHRRRIGETLVEQGDALPDVARAGIRGRRSRCWPGVAAHEHRQELAGEH